MRKGNGWVNEYIQPVFAARVLTRMFKNPPSEMHSGPIKLVLENTVDIEPGGDLVPFYHFSIMDKKGNRVGHLNFKVGDTPHVRQCAGHIGYEVLPGYRGNAYAYFACDAIRPFVKTFYASVILTCDPGNISSIKTIEKLNGKYIDEIKVPEHDPAYKRGSRRKRRYEWEP